MNAFVQGPGLRAVAALVAVMTGGPLPSASGDAISLVMPGAARAAEPAAPPDDRDVADMDLDELVNVRVSPFDVSTRRDRGYLASSSVTASRLDTPIRDLPFAIQAFTEAFVEDQRPVTVFDVARWAPGVTYRSNDFNEGNANVAIRGFAVGSLAGGNVHVLRDGFHGPSILDFTNVARVEVVKGPASFLYGQVAPGGVVNVITKAPQARPAASVEVTGGSYGQHRIDVDATGPVAGGAALRLATSYDRDLRYWKPYDARSWDVAPSLLWRPHERVGVTIKAERFHKLEAPQVMQKPGYGAQAGLVPTASDPNLSGVDVPGLPDDWSSASFTDYRRSDTTGVGAWIDVRLDDHWNARVAWSHQDYEVDAVFSGNFGMASNATRIQGRRVRFQTYTNDSDAVEAQAVARYDLGGASLRLLLGGQRLARRFASRAGQAPNDPALGSDPIASPLPRWDLGDPSTWDRDTTLPISALTASRADQEVTYLDASGYGGSTFGFFGDRLLVLAGWRLTSTRAQAEDRVSGASQPRATATRLAPQYGVLWRLGGGLAAFASYSESFVPGGNFIRDAQGDGVAARPTEGRGYDVGVKGELLGGRLSTTLTLFEIVNRNIVSDLAQTSAGGTVVIYNAQGGRQRSRGVEWDATAVLTDAWQLYLSYGYMDARILEFSGDDAAILARDPATLDEAGRQNWRNVRRFHGAPLQMSAPHLANLWTRYEVPRGPLRGVHLRGGLNHVRDQTLLPDTPRAARQTYTLVTAAVGYAWTAGGLRASLELMGKNLAGERYRPSQSTRARPRELLVTLSARP